MNMLDHEKMSVNDTKKIMREYHDVIKDHAFRLSFNSDLWNNYKNLWNALINEWRYLIYYCDESFTEFGKDADFGYGAWIHNYYSCLPKEWRGSYINRKYFEYLEMVLQTTHDFLDGGKPNYFYEYMYYSNKHECIPTKFVFINPDEVPKNVRFKKLGYIYLPISRKLVNDVELYRNMVHSDIKYWKQNDKEKEAIINSWNKNVRPFIDWFNENYITNPMDNFSANVHFSDLERQIERCGELMW